METEISWIFDWRVEIGVRSEVEGETDTTMNNADPANPSASSSSLSQDWPIVADPRTGSVKAEAVAADPMDAAETAAAAGTAVAGALQFAVGPSTLLWPPLQANYYMYIDNQHGGWGRSDKTYKYEAPIFIPTLG